MGISFPKKVISFAALKMILSFVRLFTGPLSVPLNVKLRILFIGSEGNFVGFLRSSGLLASLRCPTFVLG